MKTEIKIPVRAYPVVLKDTRTGELLHDTIVLEKSRLQAGAMFDLSDEDIICRIYNRKGYRVLEIGKPDKVELAVDLQQLYQDHVAECNALVQTMLQEETGNGN